MTINKPIFKPMYQSGPWQKAIHTGIHSFFLYEIGTKGDIDRGK